MRMQTFWQVHMGVRQQGDLQHSPLRCRAIPDAHDRPSSAKRF